MSRRVLLAAALACVIALASAYVVWHLLRPPTDARNDSSGPGPITINDPRAFQGCTLIAPMNFTKTYLIDMQGRIVHTWECARPPSFSTFLLDNGNLLRTGRGELFHPDAGGLVKEFTWDGELVWEFRLASQEKYLHHDIARLPNGNILMIFAEHKTAEEAAAVGLRRPGKKGLMADGIIEVKPTGKTSGDIVWQWHVWDHIVQDQDDKKANFARIAERPERIDINFGQGVIARAMAEKGEVDKLRALGYLGGGPVQGKLPDDWTHINSITYNAELDQIMLSVRAFSEIWIIDHSTTTKEAAGSLGGKYGKGGDLLFRWGNPQAHAGGGPADRRLFEQHDAHWIGRGLAGAGHVLLFNNGVNRPSGRYSSVDEIALPVSRDGTYAVDSGAELAWSYTAGKNKSFFSRLISGAQRLPNGNTLICAGVHRTVIETTPEQEVVWKFVYPDKTGPGAKGGLFRACRYGPDHPALAGRELRPGKKIGEP